MAITFFFAGIIGAAFNWVRGGNAITLVGEKFGVFYSGILNAIDKVINDIAFGLLFTFLVTGGFDLVTYAVLHATMLLGRAPGWGVYIGGIIDKSVAPEKEIEWIDDLVLNDGNYPVLRHVAALSLRGVMWSASLVAGLFIAYSLNGLTAPQSLIPLLVAGLPFGLIVLLSVEFADKFDGEKYRNKGWGYSEIAMGFYLWGIFATFI